MIKCRGCGRENEDSYSFCQDCGARLAPPAESPLPGTARPVSGFRPETPPLPRACPPVLEDNQRTSVLEKVPRTGSVPVPAIPVSLPPEEKKATREPTTPRAPVALPGSLQTCRYCGAEVSDRFRFCGMCGRPFQLTGRETDEELAEPAGSKAPQPHLAALLRMKEDETPDFCFYLPFGETLIGREMGDLVFSSDNLLSRRHLRIVVDGRTVTLEDLGSTNGTYLRLKQAVPLQNGDYLLIGKQILRFDLLDGASPKDLPEEAANRTLMLGSLQPTGHARLVKQLFYGQIGNEYLLTEECTTIGREAGDITFRNDTSVSPKHARILRQGSSYLLEDLNSSKGTYVRLRAAKRAGDSDFFVIGNQVFQVRIVS